MNEAGGGVPLKTKRSLIALGLVLLTAFAAAAAWGASSKTDGKTSAASPLHSAVASSIASHAATLKVGLVTDIGGLNDKSFNFLANKGLQEAKSKLGVTVDVKESHSNT